ncbi:MAG: sensor histidine kinase [bacterium]
MTPDTMIALLFQSLCTLALSAVHLGLWRQRRQPFHAIWAGAWALYAVRLALIAGFMEHRELVWLFVHQVVTLWTGLLLLWAAWQYALHGRWRRAFLLAPLAAAGWAWFAVFVMHDMAVAGLSSAVLLSGVTLATAFVFWRRDRQSPSVGARVLTWAFLFWGLHHLDYPLLRSQGSGVLIGVFMDMTLIAIVAVGTLALVLGEERVALERRSAQLEELSAQLLRAQEEERRRIARELHDEAGQTLTALKIELDLEGRRDASARVAEVLRQVRDVSELLRPRALDDLGLAPALRVMAEDFSRRTRIPVEIAAAEDGRWPPETALALFRVAQEALTNVARHSGAARAWLRLERDVAGARLVVEDDGRGFGDDLTPHLGLLGMRERLAGAGGTLVVGRAPHGGVRIEARVPVEASS